MNRSDQKFNLSSEGDLSSFLTEPGRKSTVDEGTILQTPAPLAASTVLRDGTFKKRPRNAQHLLDSFLNAVPESSPNVQGLEDLPLMKFSFSSEWEKTGTDSSNNQRTPGPEDMKSRQVPLDSSGRTSVGGRSSMGILQLDGMADLSHSMLLEASPEENIHQDSPLPKNRLKSLGSEHVYSSDDEELPKNLGTVRRLVLPKVTGTVKKNLGTSNTGTVKKNLNTSSTGTVKKNLNTSNNNKQSDTHQTRPPVMSMAFNNDNDPDVSIHEVKLGEEELMKFDEDFSDFEDLDETLPEGEQMPVNFRRLSRAKQKVNSTSFAPIQSGARSGSLEEFIPIQGSLGRQSEGGNMRLGTDETDGVGLEMAQNDGVVNRHTTGQFEGEGQESGDQDRTGNFGCARSDAVRSQQESLDQRYFRKSPRRPDAGDGGEGGLERDGFFSSQISLAFGDGEPNPPPSGVRGQGAGIEDSESEIDTDDELEAVRKQNRSYPPEDRSMVLDGCVNGGDEDSSLRPGLEGAGSSDDTNGGATVPQTDLGQRERGEGIVQHQNSSRMSNASRISNASSATNQGQQTTSDVFRTMGFVPGDSFSRPEQFIEDDPEAQTRIRPVGDDLFELHTSGIDTHVRFASGIDYRSRSLSGASFDRDNTSNSGSDQVAEPNSRLDSLFYAPTNRQTGDDDDTSHTSAWVEESNFHLEFPDSQYDLMTTERGEIEGEQDFAEDVMATPIAVPQRRTSELDHTMTQDDVFTEMAGIEDDSNNHHFSLGAPFELEQAADLDKAGQDMNEGGEMFAEFEGPMSFHTSFGHEMFGGGNPFDASGGAEQFQQCAEEIFADEEFMSNDKGIALLDADEKEFQKEHQSFKEDWSLHSVRDISRPSWLESDHSQAGPNVIRMSVGTFIKSRTHPLGSLEGCEGVERPTFGSKIITPPSNRKPIVLLEASSTQQQTIHEDQHEEAGGVEPKRSPPITLDDLTISPDTEQKLCDTQTEGRTEHVKEDQDNYHTPDTSGRSSPMELNSNCSTPAADKTGFIDNSALSRYILSASSSQNPKALAENIMRMSNDRAAVKRAERQKLVDEANKREQELKVERKLDDGLKTPKVTFAKQSRSIAEEVSPVMQAPQDFIDLDGSGGGDIDIHLGGPMKNIMQDTLVRESLQSPRHNHSKIPVAKSRPMKKQVKKFDERSKQSTEEWSDSTYDKHSDVTTSSEIRQQTIPKYQKGRNLTEPRARLSATYEKLVPRPNHQDRKSKHIDEKSNEQLKMHEKPRETSGGVRRKPEGMPQQELLVSAPNTQQQGEQGNRQMIKSRTEHLPSHFGERECGEGKSFTKERITVQKPTSTHHQQPAVVDNALSSRPLQPGVVDNALSSSSLQPAVVDKALSARPLEPGVVETAPRSRPLYDVRTGRDDESLDDREVKGSTTPVALPNRSATVVAKERNIIAMEPVVQQRSTSRSSDHVERDSQSKRKSIKDSAHHHSSRNKQESDTYRREALFERSQDPQSVPAIPSRAGGDKQTSLFTDKQFEKSDSSAKPRESRDVGVSKAIPEFREEEEAFLGNKQDINKSRTSEVPSSHQEMLNKLSMSPVTRTEFVDSGQSEIASGEKLTDVAHDVRSKKPVVRHIHRHQYVEDKLVDRYPLTNDNNNSNNKHAISEQREEPKLTTDKNFPKSNVLQDTCVFSSQNKHSALGDSLKFDGSDQIIPDDSRLSYSLVLPEKHAKRLAKMQDEIVDSESSSEESQPDVRDFEASGKVPEGLLEEIKALHLEDGGPDVWRSPRPSSVTSKKIADEERNQSVSRKYVASNLNKSGSPIGTQAMNSSSSPHSSFRKPHEKASSRPPVRSDGRQSRSNKSFSPARTSVSPSGRRVVDRSLSPRTDTKNTNLHVSRTLSSRSRSPQQRSYSSQSLSPGSRLSGSPSARDRISRSPESRASKRSSIGIVSPSPHATANVRHNERQYLRHSDHAPDSVIGSLAFGESLRSTDSVHPSDYTTGHDRHQSVEAYQPTYHHRRPPSVTSLAGSYVPPRSVHHAGHTSVVSSIVTPHVHTLTGPYIQHVDAGTHMGYVGQQATMGLGVHSAYLGHHQPLVGVGSHTGLLGSQQPVYMTDYRGYNMYPSGSATRPAAAMSSVVPTNVHPYSTPIPIASITTPSDLRFTNVCCVGLSTQAILSLKNPTARWVQCCMKVTAVRVDGVDQASQQSNPFTLKEKTIVEPNATGELKVIFLPKLAGVYVAQLEVRASPVVSDQSLEPDRMPSLVTIQAVAEKPNIQVVTEGDRLLNFGEMPWGCTHGLPITLVNNGQAKIPLRMTISANKSSSHCFSFDRDTSPSNTSIISNTARPVMPSFTRSMVNLTLEGRGDGRSSSLSANSVRVVFHAPKRFDKASLLSPPEEFSGRVDIEVDSPSHDSTICCVTLKCIVGSARLHMPRNMEKVLLKSNPREPTTAIVPIRNAGNITLDVSLCVTEWEDQFVVLPSHVKIEPDQDAEVVVKFTPKVDGKMEYLSQLLLCIEPNGRAYEVELQGVVNDPDAEVISPPSGLSSVAPGMELLSSKELLAWGGVAIGKALQQKLVLCNNTNTHMKLLMRIKGDSIHDFQLQCFSEVRSKTPDYREVILQPREEFPVHVIFAPTKTGTSSAKLQIRPKSSTRKYSIPLMGYGGVSNLVVENVRTDKHGNYWDSFGPLAKDKNTVIQVVLKNNGSRPAYVKGLCFPDFRQSNTLPLNRATVQPSEFCIEHSETKTVVIALHPSERETLLCSEKPFMVCAIGFYYGDELARQRFRSSVQRNGVERCEKARTEPLTSVKFDVSYHGEEHVPQEYTFPETPYDQELFYSTMKTIKLGLTGEPPLPTNKRFGGMQPLAFDDSVATVFDETLAGDPTFFHHRHTPHKMPSNDRPPTPPMRGPLNPHMRGQLNTFKTTVHHQDSFTVKPDHIMLTATRKGDPAIKYIQLTNTSDRPLKFEMSWPGHCIRITPEQGTVEPKSTTSVCISASMSIFTRGLDLPWSGVIMISCDGQSKELKVQIREDMVQDESLYPSAERHPLVEQPVTPSVNLTTKDESFLDLIKLNSQELKFTSTAVGQVSETFLHMTNTSNESITWTLSSVAPVYVKHGVSAEDVFRVTYSAFTFNKTVGSLEPHADAKIPISFIPRESGDYSQYWELQTRSKASHSRSTHSIKILLVGEGHKAVGGISENKNLPALTANKRRSQVNFDDKENKPARNIVLDDHLCFPRTVVGEKSMCKMIIRNNGKQEENLESFAPDRPFVSKPRTMTIASRHYLRLPVEFRPKVSGTHESTLHIKTKDGDTRTVLLHGDAVE